MVILLKVFELGEKKIIDIFLKNIDEMPNMAIPFGDDVSGVYINRDDVAVLKTDMLVGETDIPPGMTMWQASRKAVVMNISDLAAKGVRTISILTSLGIPRKLTRKDIVDISRGLNSGAREYGAYIIGGDTNEASDLIISCTAFGISKQKKIILRSGARPGDVVAVTGNFGKTSSGLKILLEKMDAPSEIKESLLESVYLPKARLKEGLAFAESGVLTSSIDSSDGLALSLYELGKMSRVGFSIENIPVALEVEQFSEINGLNPHELALYGGEEYELLVTMDPKDWKKALRSVKRIGGGLFKIGVATKELTITKRVGEEDQILKKGWEHFKTST
jgi:thiamine-monophosphate kinase